MSSITYALSTFTNAPVLTRQAGTLINLLDTLLINGYNSQSISSLTVASGVATLTTATAHNFTTQQCLLISGSTEPLLNSRFLPTEITSTTVLKFNVSGVSDGTYTGTSTVKAAGAGWEKTYSATNIAVYRSPNVLGTRMYFYIDDSQLNYSTVQGAEFINGSGIVTDPFGAGYWFKSELANDTAKSWQFVADDRTFYFLPDCDRNTSVYCFGDIEPTRVNDPYACIIHSQPVTTLNSTSNRPASVFHFDPAQMNGTNFKKFARASNGVQKNTRLSTYAIQSIRIPSSSINTSNWGASYNVSGGIGYHSTSSYPSNPTCGFPNPSTNSLALSKIDAYDVDENSYRGTIRGAISCGQIISCSYPRGNEITGTDILAGRRLVVADYNTQMQHMNASAYMSGRIFFDITGPW